MLGTAMQILQSDITFLSRSLDNKKYTDKKKRVNSLPDRLP